MSETVLCGCVRLGDSDDPNEEHLREDYRRLDSTLPFVYWSVPAENKTVDLESHAVIRDRVNRSDTRWTGVHSVLKVLRQPVLMVSSGGPPVGRSVLEQFIERWDRCAERISGVFLETDEGFQRYPGLYASPMLPRLRRTRREQTIPADAMIRQEPTRTIKTQPV